MSALARLALVGLVRTPLRTAVRALSLAAAVALLGAMILFIGHSLPTMSAGAVRSVPIDWQGPVSSYGAATRVPQRGAQQPCVGEASPVATAGGVVTAHNRASGLIRSGLLSALA